LPEHQVSDQAVDNNHQTKNSTHAQNEQKQEPDVVAKENNYQHQKPEPARFEPKDQRPHFQSVHLNNNEPAHNEKTNESVKNIEEEPKPIPKPVQKIIPPPILKPPPLPYSNKKIEPEDKQ
jgi:hypothetical protein